MLQFLKLGGSLITDKTRPYTARPDRLVDLARQIVFSLRENPQMRLVLGHGSGSFGHQAGKKYGTRAGVSSQEEWRGFSEVWFQASQLNHMVVDALHSAGVACITISPVSCVSARGGKVSGWDITPIRTALENSLVPVIHGDVAFDGERGGTILSTEDLFEFLAMKMDVHRILLAGLEAGVWKKFPERSQLLKEIIPEDIETQIPGLGLSAGADVTGGMRAKVTQMLALVEQVDNLEVLIFSGEEPDNVQKALLGGNPGTRLHR